MAIKAKDFADALGAAPLKVLVQELIDRGYSGKVSCSDNVNSASRIQMDREYPGHAGTIAFTGFWLQ